jgi:hypothetical protein
VSSNCVLILAIVTCPLLVYPPIILLLAQNCHYKVQRKLEDHNSLVFCVVFCRSLLAILGIALSVLLRLMASDYHFGILKLRDTRHVTLITNAVIIVANCEEKEIYLFTVSCHLCRGPKFICERAHAPQVCLRPEHQYCINDVENLQDGSRFDIYIALSPALGGARSNAVLCKTCKCVVVVCTYTAKRDNCSAGPSWEHLIHFSNAMKNKKSKYHEQFLQNHIYHRKRQNGYQQDT